MRLALKKMNRKWLVGIIFLVFALILSASMILVEFLYFDKQAQGVALHNAINKTRERESFLESYLNKGNNSITAIRDSDSFKDFLVSNDHENIEEIFMLQMKSQNELMQLRFINEHGYEIIRLSRTQMGEEPQFFYGQDLQNKSSSYYFQESLNRTLNQVWYSAIDLNVEYGENEEPQNPTFRILLPVGMNDQLCGVIVINYFAEDILNQLTNAPLYDMILTDNNGYTIYHYDSRMGNDEKNWANSIENGYHISEEFPDDFDSILSNQVYETDTLVSRQLELPVYNGLTLILQLRESYIIEAQASANREYLIIIVMVVVFSLVVTFIIMRFFGNVLLNMDEIQKLNSTLGKASIIAKIGFWEFDAKSQRIRWSEGVYDIFELEQKNTEVSYDFFLSFLLEEEKLALTKAFSSSIHSQTHYFIRHKLITDKNNIKVVEESAEHYYDKNGVHTHSIGSIYDITDKITTERKYEYLLENASDGIHIVDQKGNLVEFSCSFADNLGYSKDEMKALTVADWDAVMPEEDIEKTIQSLIKEPRSFESTHRKKNGELLDVRINAKGIEYNGTTHLYASQSDITEIKLIQKELEESKERWQFAVEGNKDGLWEWNVDLGEVYFSNQCRLLLGYHPSDLSNTLDEWRKLVHPDDIEKMLQATKDYLTKKEGTYVNEHRLLCKDGTYLWVRDRGIITEFNDDQSPHKIIGTISDITDHMIAMGLLKEQTYLDVLTNLHNRKAYNERLEELLEQFSRYDSMFSLIMLDIDDFKQINDVYGHAVGDEVLKEIAKVMEENTRKNDYCYRIGGEEFMIISVGNDKDQGMGLAEKLRISIKDKMLVMKAYDKTVTVSIGVVTVVDGDTADTIFKRVDDCLYRAKDNGKDCVVGE